jgi:hypothetical protein
MRAVWSQTAIACFKGRGRDKRGAYKGESMEDRMEGEEKRVESLETEPGTEEDTAS